MFDLFVELGADDETLDFPVIYASGRAGHRQLEAGRSRARTSCRSSKRCSSTFPAPHGDPEKSLQMQITTIQYNEYVGRIGVGRIYNGKIKTGQQVIVVRRDGTQVKSKVQQVQVFEGLGRKNVEEARAGDIVALVGLESVDIGDTHLRSAQSAAAGGTEIEPPTLTMMFKRERLAVLRQGRQVRHQPKHPRTAA